MTHEDVKELFYYDAETGLLSYRDGRPINWSGAGRNRRYLTTSFRGKKYYAHRLVWLYHNPEIPEMIDHIDRDTRNNRIENLRPCTNAQNQYNAPRKVNNRSGYKGVAFCVGYRKPWRARIIVDKQVVELGYYDTPEEAAQAYARGAEQHAKEFAHTGRKD